jgi:hypothetical protein
MREGPGASTALLGELDAGSTVEILGETEGWKRVQTPDGRTGFVWGEHLVEGDAAPEAPRRPDPPRPVAEEVRDLRSEVTALRQRPDPATAADLERVRIELDRLATAHRDLTRRLDDRLAPGALPLTPPPEGTSAATPIAFLIGGLVGWAASRVVQRRRDRRQRYRLRF